MLTSFNLPLDCSISANAVRYFVNHVLDTHYSCLSMASYRVCSAKCTFTSQSVVRAEPTVLFYWNPD